MSNRHQELASPKQTALGKDFSNPLIVDSLLKTIWFINAPCYCNKALTIPGQTATGKELSNPLMAAGSDEFHQIVDFLAGSHIRYALTANSTIYVSLIEQFWQTATVKTITNGEQKLIAIVDGHKFTITEASVRRHLQLADVDSISSLPNTENFENLTQMSNIATAIIFLATNRTFNFSQLIFDGVHVPLFDAMIVHDLPGQGEGPTLFVESQHTPIISPHTLQPTSLHPITSPDQSTQEPTSEPYPTSLHSTEPQIQQTITTLPHDSPLPGGYTPGSDEGSQKLAELTNLCTKLADRVTSLEKELKHTKEVHGNALTKLVKKFKKLEDKLKSTTKRRKSRMVLSDDEEDTGLENSSKQGRMDETEFADVEEEFAAKILAQTSSERVKTYKRRRITNSPKISTAEDTAEGTARGIFDTAEETDEDIAKRIQEEDQAKAIELQEQERLNLEAAKELQRQLEHRQATDDIEWQTIVQQVQESQSGSMIRYQTLKRKPVTVAQARKNMMTYLKNMAGYKMNYFKGMSYDQIRPIFEKEYNKVQTLFQKEPEVEKTMPKRAVEETLLQESFKKLKAAQVPKIVPSEEFKVEVLQTKHPIMDWEIHIEDSRKYWKLIRVSNITEAYYNFQDMLTTLDREDLDTQWRLVKDRFTSAEPAEDMEKAL
ncbi:hypothetical protein Tco_0543351 [Tanacetum coccineum]